MIDSTDKLLTRGQYYENLIINKMGWKAATKETNIKYHYDASGFFMDQASTTFDIKSGDAVSKYGNKGVPIEYEVLYYDQNGKFTGKSDSPIFAPYCENIAYYDVPTKMLYVISTEKLRQYVDEYFQRIDWKRNTAPLYYKGTKCSTRSKFFVYPLEYLECFGTYINMADGITDEENTYKQSV